MAPSASSDAAGLIHPDGYVYAYCGANTKFVFVGVIVDPRETAQKIGPATEIRRHEVVPSVDACRC